MNADANRKAETHDLIDHLKTLYRERYQMSDVEQTLIQVVFGLNSQLIAARREIAELERRMDEGEGEK